MNAMPPRAQPVPPTSSPALRRLQMVSTVLLFLAAVAVACVEPIRRISIYAVAVVPVVLVAAITAAARFWFLKSRLDRAEFAARGKRIDLTAKGTAEARAARAAARFIADAESSGDLSAAAVTRPGSRRTATGYAPPRPTRFWWRPR